MRFWCEEGTRAKISNSSIFYYLAQPDSYFWVLTPCHLEVISPISESFIDFHFPTGSKRNQKVYDTMGGGSIGIPLGKQHLSLVFHWDFCFSESTAHPQSYLRDLPKMRWRNKSTITSLSKWHVTVVREILLHISNKYNPKSISFESKIIIEKCHQKRRKILRT